LLFHQSVGTPSIRRIHLLGFVDEVRHIHESMPDRRFCFVLGPVLPRLPDTHGRRAWRGQAKSQFEKSGWVDDGDPAGSIDAVPAQPPGVGRLRAPSSALPSG
jgi:hypothetical protein